MLSDYFLLQLIFSFIVGGVIVSLSILLAEKFGPNLGAIILSLPTTSFVAFFFIGLTNSAVFVSSVVPFSLVAMAIYLVFLTIFILLCEKFGKVALLLAILSWFVLAYLVLKFPIPDLTISLLSFIVVYALVNVYFKGKSYPVKQVKKNNTVLTFLLRSIFSGLVICTAVFLSKTSGAEWGGLFAMFPATTISSYAIFSTSYKKEFVLSVATKMLPFSLVIVSYSVFVYFTYPVLGIYEGTVLSYALAAVFSYALNQIVK